MIFYLLQISTVPEVPGLGRALLVTAMNGRVAFIYEDDNRHVALPNTSGSGHAFSYVNLVNLLQGMIEVIRFSSQCLSHAMDNSDRELLRDLFHSAMA